VQPAALPHPVQLDGVRSAHAPVAVQLQITGRGEVEVAVAVAVAVAAVAVAKQVGDGCLPPRPPDVTSPARYWRDVTVFATTTVFATVAALTGAMTVTVTVTVAAVAVAKQVGDGCLPPRPPDGRYWRDERANLGETSRA
jgi:hypothetical protein